jgi:ribonuclease VapC
MVVDSSALVAMILREPDAQFFESKINAATVRMVSAASVLETAIVLQQRTGERGARDLDRFLADSQLQMIPIDLHQLRWARHAVETYGRGQHPAKLNFGDGFSYALAKSSGEPLLFKGADFSLTDLAIA